MKNLSFILLFFTISFLHSQNWQWAKNVSYSFTPNGNHLAAGDLGTFYMSTNSPTVGTCLAKFDASGTEMWRNYINGNIAINGITYRSKNVFITGTFENTAVIGNDTLISYGSYDAFLACFGTNGNFIWAKSFGGKDEDQSNDICSDKNDNIYITGQYSGKAYFDASSLVCQGMMNMYLTKLDKDGNILLLKSAGCKDSLGGSSGTKIKVDSIGNTIILGDFNDIVLDTNHVTNNNPYGAQFLCKLDSLGKTSWVEVAIDGTYQLFDFTLDDSCNILSGGSGGWHYGGTALIRKYKSPGTLDWAKPCSGGWYSGASATSIATDGSNSFITGHSQLQFNATYISYNFFLLAKFDSTGALKYCDTIRIGLASNNEWASGADIIRDSNGDFIIVGGMKGTFNLGSYSLNTPTTQIFIAKFTDNKIVTDVASKKQPSESKIYPNPSSGIFNVSLKARTANTKICVLDVLGNCVLDKDYRNETDLSLDLGHHAKGVYFVEIISGGEKMIQKVILQ